MARFYADNGLKRSDPLFRFVGWDELGGEVVEATNAATLGRKMPWNFEKAFEAMEPGQTVRTEHGGKLERHY